ncbi:MAG: phosphoribosylformylglycinamidine cyclo-ligase [Lachnospiraceae bacterium]|nr:phosphoribosylformylglycinamidine cyclo-ligase [Lachnospiraceae bacterium]
MGTTSRSEAYAAAGVDIEAGYKGVKLMKNDVERTFTPGVLTGIGGFGGLFAPDLTGMKEPVFVSGTDGVGTKQRIAQILGKFDTVGIDCVAMCVNDIICCGAKPLFFLDYIAIGKNIPEKVATLVSGVAEGCIQSGSALIGGETAEHPGTMAEDDFDLAGFSVGVVDRCNIIDQSSMKAGDAVIALPSTGVHSNGFSLVRKVFDVENADLTVYSDELGMTIGEALLTPTKIYVKPVLKVLETAQVHGISHITGGGFYENIPRSIPDGLGAKIDRNSIKVLPIFDMIAKKGNVSERDMFNTYNMGVGMAVITSADTADAAIASFRADGIDAYIAGEIISSQDKITII